MTTTPDLPALDALHAAASPGPWRQCGNDRGGCVCGWVYSDEFVVADTNDNDADLAKPPEVQRKANAALFAALRNAYPALSARIREFEAENARLTLATHGAPVAVQRLILLEETLRGIRQEKADELLDTTSPGTRGTLEREIAWIDRVLRGET